MVSRSGMVGPLAGFASGFASGLVARGVSTAVDSLAAGADGGRERVAVRSPAGAC